LGGMSLTGVCDGERAMEDRYIVIHRRE
jgi:hypothetical protein